jgi:ferredoxin
MYPVMNTNELVPLAATRPAHTRRRVPLPHIDPHRCTGCGRCVAACEPHLLSLEAVRWTKRSVLHEPQRCTGCSRCARRCPFDAITMKTPPPGG